MFRWLYIPLVLMLWSFIPKQAVACEKHIEPQEKSCHKPDEQQQQENEHACCKDHPQDHKDHAGKCSSENGACCCVVPHVLNCCLISFEYDFSTIIPTEEKIYHTLSPALISSGFFNIFIPPKIA